MTEGHSENIIVDLNAIGLKWAKEIFSKTKTWKQWIIWNKHLNYTFDWSSVVFEFEKPEYIINKMATNDEGDLRYNKTVQPDVKFGTIFTNETECEQEFSFKNERIIRSVAKISVERGVSFGGEVGLKLKLPEEVLEANVGFKKEISVKRITEDTTEEEMNWGVNNVVKVKAKMETTSELVVEEVQGPISQRTEIIFLWAETYRVFKN